MSRHSTISPDDDETHVRMDLGNAPEIATELGHMCVAWAAVEFRIFAFFVRLTDIPPPLARATFYSHHNTRARSKLLFGVATMLFSQDSAPMTELAELDSILTAINKTALNRNKYIHDPWGAWDKMESAVFQVRLGGAELLGRGHRVKKNELEQLTSQIQKHAEVLYELYTRVLPLIPPLREKLAKLQGLDLVFATRDIPPEVRPKGPKHLRRSSPEKPSRRQKREAALKELE
jgi:hypothetical protein